jgi:ketosteroid isomerase-like protein
VGPDLAALAVSVRAVVLALVCAAGCAAPRVFSAHDDAAVRAVLLAQRDAWNRGDLTGYMAGYARSPDLVFTAAGQIRRGYDETLARYRAKYTDARAMGHLDFELLSVQPLGADGAIILGRWRLTNTPVAAGGVFSVALARDATGWHVVHDHTSIDPPPPPPP